MTALKHYLIISATFISAVIIFPACSSYTFHKLSVNGQKEHQFSLSGCRIPLRANQNETLGTVNLQFQVTKGMQVHLDELRLSLNGEQISPKLITARHRGKELHGSFKVTQVGTLTLTLDKSLVDNRTQLQILPSAFISCNKQNLISHVVNIPLKDLK